MKTIQKKQSDPRVEIITSRHFLQWLHEQRISLAFTTYQTNRLFLLGLKPDGALSIFERLFDRPMGLYADPGRLYMSTRYQLWQSDNILEPGELYEGYDSLYVPRVSHVTGDLDIHDVALNQDNEIVFVNTQYSCLSVLHPRHSFRPVWKPPFISELVPQDRCHLNGLAMKHGKPAYMTAVSRSDVPSGWRSRREDGGCLMDVTADEIVLTGLSMPHSPRIYQDRVWLLNSGAGEFGYFDSDRFNPVVFCPGYLRGLAFHGDFAIVGLSKPRHDRTFMGLPIDRALAAKDAAPRCGIAVIDLKSGYIAHWADIEGVVVELYDVVVLPDIRRPMAFGFKSDEISRVITFKHDSAVVRHTLPASDMPGRVGLSPGLPLPSRSVMTDSQPDHDASPDRLAKYRFQLSLDMTVESAVSQFETLTFPNIRNQARERRIHEPLIATVSLLDSEMVGMALGETRPDGTAWFTSLFVNPEHRRQGIGDALVRALGKAFSSLGYDRIHIGCRPDWSDFPLIEHILKKRRWNEFSPPEGSPAKPWRYFRKHLKPVI
ncbi:TIGR03032 family protein [Desulfococcaceae bacterium HSG8]|nr:TIGR03032 family protein [Desulfococcaceae bacterium HSG8]